GGGGWKASDGDKAHFPWIHKVLCPELPVMAHIIITITKYLRTPSYPTANAFERNTGFTISADGRKIWIKGYSTELDEEEDEDGDVESFYHFSEKIHLDIPSLEKRFL
ncbi:MAG: hypothetical protein WCI06_05570, partial [Methylococcaceae bacterium]